MAEKIKERILNFNIGVLGHVDSGKTSLAKALSTTASTASFDKNPQSQERGITLDLGFSSFQVALPEHLRSAGSEHDLLQMTLVDCPGHASLIKTIIGGAQIIDMMMLVVDVTKGVQTQTAECLVIGEILCQKMVVVLNKVDLLKPEKRDSFIEKMSKRLTKTLENTRFAGSPIISVAAKPGGPEAPVSESIGVTQLINKLREMSYIPERTTSGSLLFAVDHCFSIRGQGTIMTGTILSGSVCVNDTVEIPSLKVTKKVKSMQMFKKPVDKASQGDRVGICVTQFDPHLLERGIVCSPSSVPTVFGGIISVRKISYYKGAITTKSKFHITIGHETVMGKLQVFGLAPDSEGDEFNFDQEYIYQDEVADASKQADGSKNEDEKQMPMAKHQWLVVEFEKPVSCPEHSLVIGSRLDADIHLNMCRIAFHGKLIIPFKDKSYSETILSKLKVYKTKCREGIVERMSDEYSVIARSLFKKETNIQTFTGMKVNLSTGECGTIEGGFGQSGKVKIRIPGGLLPDTAKQLAGASKKKGKGAQAVEEGEESVKGNIKVILEFKRYIHDTKKKMVQS
ncbi:predicted protein [Nematostella vectensis]|uniref:Selenocysteine-specific elongation factor n=1 Tax=Nematostella vectensis TaxID=45351 RepID=A7S2Z6_NEMVE|nr:selenocysteine-specific elongation factor [Nematostella vectensis]EDO41867.1 predicted protein [Nematostella vectensis]|eukprot:XP_001633930.1 predicted protein [Nematostella vectensis]